MHRSRFVRFGALSFSILGVVGCSSGSGLSSEGDQQPPSGGSAGASGSGGLAGGGATSGAAGRNGGGAAGANGGSAGTSGGSAGAQGGGGKGGAGAGGATAGGGGVAQGLACPENPPGTAVSCNSDGQVCFYEDCAGAGRTVATCQRLGGARLSWTLQTAACGAVQCVGLPSAMSCTSGQICSVSEGGTIGGMCAESSCGTGPVTCACAHASCTNCAISGGVGQGFTVTCSNCPQGGCA